MVILNMNKKTRDESNINPIEITIGNSTIKQENAAKLLGIYFNDRQNWSTQIQGPQGVVSALNKRLFAIKRLKNHVKNKFLDKIVDGLFTSKISYGVQLYGKVRLSVEDPINKDIKAIQMVQNKLARLLNGKTLKDKIPTNILLRNANLLSVNQINAKVKLQEIWKILNIEDYPIKIALNSANKDQMATRSMSNSTPIEQGSTALLAKTCISDAIKLWNIAPSEIKACTSLHCLKKRLKEFAKTLPI